MPDPLSIFYLQTNGTIGGTELMNLRHSLALQARGHQMTTAILDDDESAPLVEPLRAAGIPVHCLHGRTRSWPAIRRHIRRLLQEGRYDIVHLFGLRSRLLGQSLVRRQTTAALVVGQRTSGHPWPRVWLERLLSRPVDRYIANSAAGADWLQRRAGIAPARITTIHSGLDPSPYLSLDRIKCRRQLEIPPAALIILCVANLRPVKDHHTLIRAFSILCEDGLPGELWLAGDGPEAPALKAGVAAAGLEQRVRFLGERDDIPALLGAADIKVLSSRREGLPASVLEAMAAGRPVVATAVGGLPELVVAGVTGTLVPSGGPLQLAAALRELILAPEKRARLGAAGQQRLLSHFQLAVKIEALEAAYLALRK